MLRPWLATSTSTQRATNQSPSGTTVAVRLRVWLMLLLAQAVAGSDAPGTKRGIRLRQVRSGHTISARAISRSKLSSSRFCLNGANACPPKDCGGTGGYADLLEALA